ncbi:MAG: ABC transporter permease [Thermodesulfobacteriota bacterium]
MNKKNPLQKKLKTEKRHLSWMLEALVTLMKTKPLGIFGGGVVILLLLTALLAPSLAPYGYDDVVSKRLSAPSARFWMGTDYIGRDILSRIVYGARLSVFIGFGAIAIGTLGAALIGILTGYFGGKLDMLVQRVVDSIMAFPMLILIISVIAIIGLGILNLIFALGLLMAANNSRVIRSAVLSIKESQYIESAHATGAGHIRILFYHILPNVMPPIIVIATVNIGSIILIEASLSFLGLGVPPPNPSWGGMLSGQTMAFFRRAPWLALFPGAALSLTVFAFNMFGDALRDVLDPRLRGTMKG